MLSQKVTFKRALTTLLLFSFSLQIQFSKTFAQINKNGLPLLRNYSQDEYDASGQNWSIVKDKRGVMYFANNFGVLEYNGVRWELFDNANSQAIRALEIDNKGYIYYGAFQDFGVMLPDSIGRMNFFSLYKAYSKKEADFNTIWRIHSTGDRVLFQANEGIYSFKASFDTLSQEKIKESVIVYKPEQAFHWSCSVNGKFYVREVGKGIMELNGDELTFIQESEIFANQRIYAMLPYPNEQILICTRENGLYVFNPKKNGERFKKLECDANDILIQSIIYGGTKISDDRFAISTLANGIIIIDEKGAIVEHLSVGNGLPDQQILAIYYDNKYGKLWFATAENGIFKADVGGPFRQWNRDNGLNGVIADVVRYNEKLFVATNNGIFYLEDKVPGNVKFKTLSEIAYESWSLLDFSINDAENRLLVGTSNGVYEIGEKRINKISDGYVFKLKQSDKNKNQVYVGYADGFGVIEYNSKSKKWKTIGRNNSINNVVRDIYERKDGKIFLGTQHNAILLLNDVFENEIIRIDTAKGLPIDGSEFKIFNVEDKTIFTTQNGLFNYNDETNKVDTFYNFGEEFSGQDLGVYSLLETDGDYWLSLYSNELKVSKWQGVAYLKKSKDNKFDIDYSFSKIIPQKVSLVLYRDEDFLWIGNEKGLYKFDRTVRKNYDEPYNISILRVTTADSLLFAGTFYEKKDSIIYISLNQIDRLKPELVFKNNQLRFEFSALFYDQEENTEYSYRLIGLNEKWSKWTKETMFPFTNLPPRDYRFEVKAKNIYGTESHVTSYEFTILPPWYLTTWAIALFAVTVVFLVWLIVRLNVRRLKKDKERLEKIVEERTVEIRMKNVELEQQKEEILAQRDEIEAQRDHVMEQKDQIEVQHNMILEQTKSITDSIHYASRIQEALLPPAEVLNEVLPEHFILYRPRDIVSGDFYWASTKNNRTIIVAADCTGHGVPGAFMSMLGISFLNEIINKFEHLHANQILNELKASVKKSLRQTGKDDEAKDGMDMALCILDFEKMQMEFSGAYNSMFLIRNNELIKYEADRMPVGIYVKDRGSFTNHIIDMKEGDNYYIFSDGYPDQFGGVHGSKLMIKRFKNLLLENHQKPSMEQRKALENFLNDWQSYKDVDGKNYRQLDDILVIGMKV